MRFFGRLFKARVADGVAAPVAVSHGDARLAVDAASISESGPVREHNEDRVLMVVAEPGLPGDPPVHLFALADGMGGHQAGEVASELAIDTSRSTYLQDAGADPTTRIANAMHAANAAVYAASLERAERQGMGTTLLLLALSGRSVNYAWVGDSRLYRWRESRLEQITEDDTLVLRMARDGLIPMHEVPQHPDRNILSQALGTHPQIPELHVGGPIEAAAGDRFLLCSDGVHDVLADASLASTLGAGSAREAAQALVDAAINHGTQDNVSACVVCLSAAGQSARTPRVTATIAANPVISSD